MEPRILLVPAVNVDDGRLPPYISCGLLSLQSLAERHGGGVDILSFAPLDEAGRRFTCSEDLAEAVVDLIDADTYPIVGFSTMCGSFHHSLSAACLLARVSPRTRIWFGGPHASAAPESLLAAFPEIEAVFVGEGETSFATALERRREDAEFTLDDLPGVCTRHSKFSPGAPIADLDGLPFMHEAPAFAEAVEAAGPGSADALPLEAERGCPGRCIFCSTSRFWGRRVRRKSNTRIIREMHRLNAVTGANAFELIGDNLASPRRHLLEFCRATKDDASGLEWSGQMKLDELEEADLGTLWDGGCRGFFVGVESASQHTLDRIGKATDLARELRIIGAAIDHGFKVTTSFIIGLPWETRDDIARTVALHADLIAQGVARSILSTVSPLPGTDLTRASRGARRKRAGLSLATSDGLHYGPRTVELMDRCPELFTQLDYVEAAASWAEVAAFAQAAMMISARHARETGMIPA